MLNPNAQRKWLGFNQYFLSIQQLKDISGRVTSGENHSPTFDPIPRLRHYSYDLVTLQDQVLDTGFKMYLPARLKHAFSEFCDKQRQFIGADMRMCVHQ